MEEEEEEDVVVAILMSIDRVVKSLREMNRLRGCVVLNVVS